MHPASKHRATLALLSLAGLSLGWIMGYCPASPALVKTDVSPAAANASVQSGFREIPPPDSGPDVHAILERIAQEGSNWYDGQGERAVQLFEAFGNLESGQFAAVIANLCAANNQAGSDAAMLVLGLWAERDLPAAREWMLRTSGPQAGLFCNVIFDVWARQDPAGMFEWMEAHAGDTETGKRLLGTFAMMAPQADPERALALLRKSGMPDTHANRLYSYWAKVDPQAAGERLLQEQNPKFIASSADDIIRGWAVRDPAAARAWTDRLPDPLIAAGLVTEIGSLLLYRGHPDRAAAYLSEVPPTNASRVALQNAVEKWAGYNPEAALQWAAGLNDTALGEWAAALMLARVPAARREEATAHWQQSRQKAPPIAPATPVPPLSP